MAYVPTVWENDTTEVDEDNMNHIEQGIKNNNDNLQGITSMGNIRVESIRSKNMFNQYNLNNNKLIQTESTSEELSSYTGAQTTNWIPCKPSTTYTLHGTNVNRFRIQYKNASGTIVYGGSDSDDHQTYTFTTSNNSVLFRIYFYTGNETTFPDVQIEEGSTATPYSPFQDLNNQQVYSTSDDRIGTWVDGKPIYRKVAFIENPIVDSEEHRASLGLTNPDQITRLDAYYNVSSPKQTTPLNTHNYVYNQSSYYKYNYEWNDFVYSSNTSLGTIIVIVEYTKTTD